MLAALWGYDGWDNLSFVAGEVKNPNRNIPIAIIGSVLIVIALYVGVNVSYYYVLDPTAVASVSKDSSVAMVVVSKFFGGDITSLLTGVALAIFTVGLMLSSLGTLHTSILSASRIPYAMAKDRLMVKPFERLSIQAVPVNGVIFQGVCCAGERCNFSGRLGEHIGIVWFVRHADRLRHLWLLDLLRTDRIVDICLPPALPRRRAPLPRFRLSCRASCFLACRRVAPYQHDNDGADAILYRYRPDPSGTTRLLLLE
jgi:hypothetical protein